MSQNMATQKSKIKEQECLIRKWYLYYVFMKLEFLLRINRDQRKGRIYGWLISETVTINHAQSQE